MWTDSVPYADKIQTSYFASILPLSLTLEASYSTINGCEKYSKSRTTLLETKVVKNIFLTRHEIYNINLDC